MEQASFYCEVKTVNNLIFIMLEASSFNFLVDSLIFFNEVLDIVDETSEIVDDLVGSLFTLFCRFIWEVVVH